MTIAITAIKDIAHYEGEHAIPGLRFRPARQALGVSAWGMNVLEFDPECGGYPEHNHAHDNQEEIYLVLDGSIVLIVNGDERTMKRGDMVRLPPETTRKFVTRGEPAALLAVGGTPGTSYTPDPQMSTT